MTPLAGYLALSAILFAIGLAGALTRRHAIVVLIGVDQTREEDRDDDPQQDENAQEYSELFPGSRLHRLSLFFAFPAGLHTQDKVQKRQRQRTPQRPTLIQNPKPPLDLFPRLKVSSPD